MSAIVCGKRSFFEEIPSPPVSKRARCTSSPNQFSPTRPIAESSSVPCSSSPLDHLISVFPDVDNKLLERALEECGNDLNSAIKSLNALCQKSDDNNVGGQASQSDGHQTSTNHQAEVASGEPTLSSVETPASANLPKDGTEWVDFFVKEMQSAANLDDARARAAQALEALEKYIRAHSGTDTAQNLQQENTVLKGQLQSLLHDNAILKRAVCIQNERQKEFEDKAHEYQYLKQLVTQCQEQIRTLEVNNYALSMHLKQAQQSNSSIPGRFHPDVF